MVGFVKGVFGGSGLDLSAVTLTPDKALAGEKFYDADGILRTGTIESKAAATITLAGVATSIPAGQYLAGAQTIAWDSDIAAGNIKYTKNIFGVQGSYPYTGSFTPSSATKTYTISNLPFAPYGIALFGEISGSSSSFLWPMLASYGSMNNTSDIVYDSDTWEFDCKENIQAATFGGNSVTLDFSAVLVGGAYLEPLRYRYVIW